MENLRAKFMRWRRRTSTHKYSRLEEFPDEIFDVEKTTSKNEEESVNCVSYARQSGSKFHIYNNSGNTAMHYGECNGLMKTIQILD